MSIKSWPEHDRPREKALRLGVEALSDSELLALFFRTGIPGRNALELARDWLAQHGSIASLLTLSYVQAKAMPGIGLSKFVQLQAAVELGRRFVLSELKRGDAMSKPSAVADWLNAKLRAEKVEVFAMLSLDNSNQILEYDELARGSSSYVAIEPKIVARTALMRGAERVIIAHNHPSGARELSNADINVTEKIESALQLLQIQLLDHIVIADGPPISLRLLGYLV